MGARKTSIECYHQIKAEGLLPKRRLQVLEAMLSIAPCTAGELENKINKTLYIRGGWKQLSVLREQGVVYEKGERICNITGRNVIEWDLTDNLPTKLSKTKNKSKKEKIKDAMLMIKDLGENLDSEADKVVLRKIYFAVKDI